MKDISHWARRDNNFYDRWPVGADGEKEPAAHLLDTQDSGGAADMIVSLLESCGIPVMKRYENEGAIGRVVLGFSGFGVSLYVPASRLEEAQEILNAPAQPGEEEE
ncbi:MAG: hypothetical protein ACI3W8_05430 [Oscillospiraceae bacterium]